MEQTLPSKIYPVIDVPEPKNVNAEMVYNFFTPDERVEGAFTQVPDFAKNKSIEAYEQNVIANIANYNRFVPRYVKLTWTPSINAANIKNIRNAALNYSVEYNKDKIYSEQSFGYQGYTNITFQDDQIDSVMQFYVHRLMQDSKLTSSIDFNGSFLDYAKLANTKTSDDVTPNFLSDVIANIESGGMTVEQLEENNLLKELKDVATNIQLNNLFINTSLQTMNNSVVNIYEDELKDSLANAKSIQDNALNTYPSTNFIPSTYSFLPNNLVDFIPTETVEYSDPQTFPIGYIIEKTEIDVESGITTSHNSLYIETPFVGEKIDFDIKYGYSYKYSIYSVYAISMKVPNLQTGQVGNGVFLVKSSPVYTTTVTCDDSTPPPPPADFTVSWDYVKDAPRLTWSMPVNKQRDIKYFQILRRRSINEPFELLAMYDFDDSQIKSKMKESSIDQRLIIKMDAPTTFYIDTSMTKEDVFIYTVCCVDAHGYSSNYGMQLMVSFDKYKNAIVRKLISTQGAPKSYPNALLLQDTFVDTIRTSFAKKMDVYFDPEYLDIYQKIASKKNYYDFLKTNNNTSYKMQLINVDLQKQQVFTMRLKDKRTQ